jgi:hypothetical protein
LAGRGPVRRHGEFVVAAESLPDSHGDKQVPAVAEDQIACAIQPLRRRQGSRAPAPIHSRTDAS